MKELRKTEEEIFQLKGYNETSVERAGTKIEDMKNMMSRGVPSKLEEKRGAQRNIKD